MGELYKMCMREKDRQLTLDLQVCLNARIDYNNSICGNVVSLCRVIYIQRIQADPKCGWFGCSCLDWVVGGG